MSQPNLGPKNSNHIVLLHVLSESKNRKHQQLKCNKQKRENRENKKQQSGSLTVRIFTFWLNLVLVQFLFYLVLGHTNLDKFERNFFPPVWPSVYTKTAFSDIEN